jgi:FAD/FMN-containing dehydrogenase
MNELASDKTEAFVAAFKGKALRAGDPEYDSSRAIWNGAIDRKPAVIARCADAEHVASAVRFARDRDLEISVRGGGHNYSGTAVGDGGLMVHLGAMNQVSVDPAARRVKCGGGATWGDVDAVTQQHGLATPGGFISHTGVAGLALGGGIGWLTKKAGLTCDNLIAAEVVTADGRIVQASRDANPDLLWALKGGGGNFGIVTSFEFALHPVGPLVQMGLLFAGLENGAAALRHAQEHIDALPGDINGFLAIGLSAPPAPFVPEQHRGKIGHGVIIVGFGSFEEHAGAVATLRDAVKPLWELVTPMPYVALQQMFDESAHWGTMAYEKALYIDALSDRALSVIGEHVPKKKSPLSFVPTFRLNGKYLAADESVTAFGGARGSPVCAFNICAHAPPGAPRELYEDDRAWVRSFWDAMRPYASGAGSYVNFIADAEEDRVKASYGAGKYARLARIKRGWDPDNVFHRNANIRPA